ncbi:unnamed protein product, partial [Ectocarpus sp. 8 AP-2014]
PGGLAVAATPAAGDGALAEATTHVAARPVVAATAAVAGAAVAIADGDGEVDVASVWLLRGRDRLLRGDTTCLDVVAVQFFDKVHGTVHHICPMLVKQNVVFVLQQVERHEVVLEAGDVGDVGEGKADGSVAE